MEKFRLRERGRETTQEREEVLLAAASRRKQFPSRGERERESGRKRKNKGRRNGKKGAILLTKEREREGSEKFWRESGGE